jgi:Fe-S cluster biogenesis protein NfuA
MKFDVEIQAETTPNPRSLKFIVDRPISAESCEMKNVVEAQRSPLASKLFGFPWLESVFVGPNFVTVTKQDWVDWDVLAEPLKGLIKEHIDEGEPVLMAPSVDTPKEDIFSAEDSEDVRKIKDIIENEIRPAVAMDGGDVAFRKFEEGRVHLTMKGSCSGCPSSTYTLKVGIEGRLREAVPSILEVVAD